MFCQAHDKRPLPFSSHQTTDLQHPSPPQHYIDCFFEQGCAVSHGNCPLVTAYAVIAVSTAFLTNTVCLPSTNLFFSHFPFYTLLGMLLKGMVGSCLLSKDELLTPDIDGVMYGTLNFQKESLKDKNRRKLDFSIWFFFSAHERRHSFKLFSQNYKSVPAGKRGRYKSIHSSLRKSLLDTSSQLRPNTLWAKKMIVIFGLRMSNDPLAILKWAISMPLVTFQSPQGATQLWGEGGRGKAEERLGVVGWSQSGRGAIESGKRRDDKRGGEVGVGVEVVCRGRGRGHWPYNWIGHGLQSGPTLAFLLRMSDFKTKMSFGFLMKKSGVAFFQFF